MNPLTQLPIRWSFKRAARSLALILLLLAIPAIVLADNVQNNVTVGGTDTFTVGGSTTIGYRIVATSGDGQTGCNASDGSNAVVTINTPAGVTASPNPLSFSACGVFLNTVFTANAAGNYPITVSVSDPGAGTYNTSPATFTLKVLAPADTTPPVITANVAGTLGNNGWYTSDVNVSWSVTDNESTVSSTNGCGSVTISTDTAGQTLTCSATSGGGTNSQSVTIKRDATAPTISGSASPAANGNGWNNSDVTASFTCADSLSGVASCGPNQTLSSEGAGQSASGTTTDNAGNSASATVSNINIDKTGPSVTASASPAPNGNGWNNGSVTVSFNGSDATSGIANCDAPVSLSAEGAGQSATGSCTDLAGNSASDTATVNIDKTAPTISGSASPAANGNGWNNSNVTVSFTCADSLSGVASCGPNQTLSSEGANQSASGTAVDKADNSTSTTVDDINIDKTAPIVSVTGVANGTTYTLGSVPAAGCNTSDALSGVATTASLSTSGGPIGSITATCNGATDNAGNAGASASVSYSVVYNFNGFFRPVDNLPILNQVKAGSAVPVKFSLNGNQGLNIFAAGYPKSHKINCDTSAPVDTIDETITAGSSSLSYDVSTDQYNYVWKTEKSWGSTCRQLTVMLNDGRSYTANFKFMK